MTHAASRPSKVALALLLVAVAAVAGFGGWYGHARFGPKPATTRKPDGKPADLSGDVVVALGRLRPAGGLRSVAGPPGDQIAELLVKEGDAVAAGRPLARLVSRADRKAELDLVDQQLADAEAQAKLARASGEREIDVAQARLDEQTRLAPFELKAQKTRLDYLDKQRAGAEHQLRRLRELQQVSPNTVSAQDVEGQELQLAQTVAELEAGRAVLAKAESAQQTGRRVAEAQLAAARANLERTLRELPVESLKKKRVLAQLQYDRTELPAPAAGRVVKVAAHAGDPTGPQQPILDLADTATMQAVAEVYETDIRRLRSWGRAKATIRSRALPSDLAGAVTSVGTVIARNAVFDTDPTADADRRVFEVVVTLDGKSAPVAADYLNLQVQVFFEPNK